MLVKYVRNKKGQRVGVVVAIDKNRIGWSKCNFSKGDRFDRERGKFIAQKRAEKYVYDPTYRTKKAGELYWQDFLDYHHITQCVRPDFLEMVDRASHYFK